MISNNQKRGKIPQTDTISVFCHSQLVIFTCHLKIWILKIWDVHSSNPPVPKQPSPEVCTAETVTESQDDVQWMGLRSQPEELPGLNQGTLWASKPHANWRGLWPDREPLSHPNKNRCLGQKHRDGISFCIPPQKGVWRATSSRHRSTPQESGGRTHSTFLLISKLYQPQGQETQFYILWTICSYISLEKQNILWGISTPLQKVYHWKLCIRDICIDAWGTGLQFFSPISILKITKNLTLLTLLPTYNWTIDGHWYGQWC